MSYAVVPPRRVVLADLVPGALVRDVALVLGGAALTGAAAQVAITTPWSPVPFTLQTLAVLVTGAALGSVRGLLSITVYMLAGLAGVPWFAHHTSGWAGPSFGYVVGFVIAAGLVGALAKRGADRHVLSTLALMAVGTLMIYAIGTIWLAVDLQVGAGEAIRLGVRPFLITDALKIALAAVAFPTTWRLVRRSHRD